MSASAASDHLPPPPGASCRHEKNTKTRSSRFSLLLSSKFLRVFDKSAAVLLLLFIIRFLVVVHNTMTVTRAFQLHVTSISHRATATTRSVRQGQQSFHYDSLLSTSPSASLSLACHANANILRRQQQGKRKNSFRLLQSSQSSTLSSSSLSASAAADEHHNDPDQERSHRHKQLLAASTLSLAPMMDYTDRNFRHLVRLISRRTLLYTEMVAANALAHERKHIMLQEDYQQQEQPPEYAYLRRFLGQGQVEPLEGPSVLQLGGSDPEQLYEASRTVLDLTRLGGYCDYTALNLNCGCPSPKVAGKGCFGAALMDDDPRRVAQLVRAMHEGCEGRLPVTIKCRIGTDTPFRHDKEGVNGGVPYKYRDQDDEAEYARLCHFIETIAADGIVTDFTIHARIAVLSKSFSPADNRNIPPLKYHLVHRLVQDFSPHLTFSLNGGVQTIEQVQQQLQQSEGRLTGVMIGRAWAADPWSFAMADQLLYGDTTTTLDGGDNSLWPRNRWQVLEAYGRHADYEESMGDPVKIRRLIVHAVTPLFTGEPNAKRFRIALDEIVRRTKQQHERIEPTTPSSSFVLSTPSADLPLSRLILEAAEAHLSEETLLRTPEESYERVLHEQRKQQQRRRQQQSSSTTATLQSVVDWQKERHQLKQELMSGDASSLTASFSSSLSPSDATQSALDS